MGNASSSNPHSRRDPPPPPPPSTLPSHPPRSRPLKHKKRSIVDHPALIVSQPPALPSSPIPIPAQPGHPSPQRPTPPRNNDSFADYVPNNIPREDNHAHRPPIQYNSTRSFGAVRRGGVQGRGWVNDSPKSGPADGMDDLVRSSIPIGLPQTESDLDLDGRDVDSPDQPRDHDEDELDEDGGLIATQIVWRGGGKEVFLAGTFNDLEWRARQRMRFDPILSAHVLTLHLPPGTYRLKFIVDDTWRCSDEMPTATDDETGNLVNYVDVEDPNAVDLNDPGAEEQLRDGRVMKANRRRTYPAKRKTRAPNSRSPTTTRAAVHPPLLPSDSFWGDPDTDTEFEMAGWERGRDGVLEKWTSEIPDPLVAAAHQEEAYMAAVQAQRELRRGGAGTQGSLGSLGMGVPIFPPPPALPRHLDKVILNTRSSHASNSGSHSGRSSKSGKHKSRTGLGMTSLLTPDSAATTVLGSGRKPIDKPASILAMEQWAQADDSSVLPVPSHVVLHHLGTSAIKNGVLAISDTTRYNKKYITTIYYKPT